MRGKEVSFLWQQDVIQLFVCPGSWSVSAAVMRILVAVESVLSVIPNHQVSMLANFNI